MDEEINISAQEKVDFYQNMRMRIHSFLQTENGKKFKYAEYLLLVPDIFHLLCKLTVDKEVDNADKVKLATAIVYFVSPIDIVPDVIVGLGYLDDLILAAFVLNAMINHTNPAIVEKHWAGDKNILDAIKQILALADEMIGAGLFKKIKNLVITRESN